LLRNNKHENQYLQNAVNKYGIENFSNFIIKECTQENLLENEALICEILKPEYNLTKEIIRNTPSKDAIEKIKATLKKGYASGKIVSKCFKPIMIYDILGNFITETKSVIDAAKFCNVTPSSIRKLTKGTHKQMKGYQCFDKGLEKPKNLKNGVRKKGTIFFVKNNSEKFIFENAVILAEFLNVSKAMIHQRMIKYNNFELKGYKITKIASVKQEELLGTPIFERQEDNQQPSLDGDIFEGSTTNGQVYNYYIIDSNTNTRILQQYIIVEDIV
jgi:hypothetical protein